MPLFGDPIALCCSNLDVCKKKWWIESFDCGPAKVPAERDDVLPSDVALTLPGEQTPAIAPTDLAELKQAGYERTKGHSVVFCGKLNKAREHLVGRGVAIGPIQDGGGTEFFEVRDPEGNVIEICQEP
jgi:hypothetical protein